MIRRAAAPKELAMAIMGSAFSSFGADAQELCKRTWWVFLLGGIASVAFGVMALVNPGVALFVLATFFAAAVLVDGAANAIGAIRHREKDGWWLMLLLGALGLAVGAFALMNPPVSILAFIYLVAFEAIALGVFTAMLGYKVRKATSREWILYLAGGLSILFGGVVLARPVMGAVKIVYLIAAWAIVVGAFKIAFAFRVKGAAKGFG
jgi:uncharacterized membrane protein HdeD (DUF308 family)